MNHYCNGCGCFVGDIRWHKCDRRKPCGKCHRVIKHKKNGQPYKHGCEE